ncbi:MAG TPA: carboxypeptidase-like regulatory domain-containing protein, partial [Pyrinomonadaceae bacterium]|nr:carboxypeptidase-like regulatory domain-containing protein [Pyrinomonadaceae bacterium]
MTIRSPTISLRMIVTAMLAAYICLVVQAQQPSPADEKAEDTKTGAITGTVVNENGQPLAGAAVFVSAVNSAGQGRTTTTDSEGNFQVKGLDRAFYRVGASIPAYVSPPRDPDDSQPSTYYRLGDSLRLVQIKGGVITGMVINSSAEPVVKVNVRASMIRDANGQPPKFGIAQFGERTTDDRGVYRIYGLAPGTYVVSAGGSGTRASSFSINAYDTDAPTYAPASSRDTAAEITVRAGDETSSVDIRY